MRQVLGLLMIAFLAFLLVADETPSSFISGLTVLFNGTQYAQSVFSERVPFKRVLASDAGYNMEAGQPTCRVALAELYVDAPEKPPKLPLIETDIDRFGGNWRPTPVTGGLSLGPDLLETCGDKMDRISRQTLAKAVAEDGSFVIRDWKNDTLQIYTAKYGLVVHLSYK